MEGNFKIGYSEEEEIQFKWILHDPNFNEKTKNKDMTDVDIILSSVVNIDTGVENSIDVDSLRSLPELMDLLHDITRRHKRTYQPSILELCCAREKRNPEKNMISQKDLAIILKCVKPGGLQVPSNSEENLLNDEFQCRNSKCVGISTSVICGFLINIVHKVFPAPFWGCTHNLHMMKKAIKHVVCMGIKDNLYVGDVIRRIKIKSFKWAEPLGSHFLISHVVGKFWIWIIKWLMTTLKSFFYITSSKSRRNQMLFFRKRTWQRLHNKALSDMINSGSVVKINRHSSIKLSEILKNTPGGTHAPHLKFVPKSEGVRPICTGGRVAIGFSTEQEIAQAKSLLEHFSLLCRSACINVSKSYAFEHAWENYIKYTGNSQEKIYFVRLDIKDAYGSILHKNLKEILDICHRKFLDSGLNKKLANLSENELNSIVVKLKVLISTQIVHAGHRTKLFIKKGVPQGGSLSPGLCNLYYSALSEQYLREFVDAESMLLRSTDDFLFVSRSHASASKFLKFMESGIPYYNCYVNEQKTFHNLISKNDARVTFCGIVLCTSTGQLLVDATALLACPPRYTFSLSSYKQPGKMLEKRMVQITLARLQSRVINPTYTTESGLIANIWRVGCMSGARFLHFIEYLKPRGHSNIKHYVKIIKKTSFKVNTRVRNIWRDKFGLLDFTLKYIKFIRCVFISGVHAAMNMKHMPLWPQLDEALKCTIEKLCKDIPEEYQAKLPVGVVLQ